MQEERRTQMFTLNKTSNSPLPSIRADESLSKFLSRLIGELLSCEKTDRVRAAQIHHLIDLTADELEIHHDLAALSARQVGFGASLS
jgi:hypothetical protein